MLHFPLHQVGSRGQSVLPAQPDAQGLRGLTVLPMAHQLQQRPQHLHVGVLRHQQLYGVIIGSL